MKKIIAILLACALLVTGCGSTSSDLLTQETSQVSTDDNSQTVSETAEFIELEDEEIAFDDLSDPNLLQYVEDNIYADSCTFQNAFCIVRHGFPSHPFKRR